MKVVLSAGTSGMPPAVANNVKSQIQAMLEGIGDAQIGETRVITVDHHLVKFTITDKIEEEDGYFVRIAEYL
jgi:hypothetical protein